MLISRLVKVREEIGNAIHHLGKFTAANCSNMLGKIVPWLVQEQMRNTKKPRDICSMHAVVVGIASIVATLNSLP